jgi:hypothetical protein
MAGGVKMPGRVLILRGVTTAYMSTDEAEAQVNPGVTASQAIPAPIRAWNDLSDFVEMRAFIGDYVFLPFI